MYEQKVETQNITKANGRLDAKQTPPVEAKGKTNGSAGRSH